MHSIVGILRIISEHLVGEETQRIARGQVEVRGVGQVVQGGTRLVGLAPKRGQLALQDCIREVLQFIKRFRYGLVL